MLLSTSDSSPTLLLSDCSKYTVERKAECTATLTKPYLVRAHAAAMEAAFALKVGEASKLFAAINGKPTSKLVHGQHWDAVLLRELAVLRNAVFQLMYARAAAKEFCAHPCFIEHHLAGWSRPLAAAEQLLLQAKKVHEFFFNPPPWVNIAEEAPALLACLRDATCRVHSLVVQHAASTLALAIAYRAKQERFVTQPSARESQVEAELEDSLDTESSSECSNSSVHND